MNDSSLTAAVEGSAQQDLRVQTEGVRYDQATMTLSKRLRAAIRIDAVNGTREDRQVVAQQIGEAAGTIDRLLGDVSAVQAQLAEAVEFLRAMVEFEDARRAYWETQTPQTLAEHERTVIAFQEAIPNVRAFLAKEDTP